MESEASVLGSCLTGEREVVAEAGEGGGGRNILSLGGGARRIGIVGGSGASSLLEDLGLSVLAI